MARVLQEWSSVSRIFHHSTRPHLDAFVLSRTLELAAAALDDHDEPITRSSRGSRVISNRQRLAALAVLGEREAQLSAIQRLALVNAAAWWLSEPNGGEELACALLAASCSEAHDAHRLLNSSLSGYRRIGLPPAAPLPNQPSSYGHAVLVTLGTQA
ncbi:MAG: hypothetical protein M3143_13405 [Actinomycetota bacterium]|nr:hypothetical protein [Actinomycetota bacterium]